MRTRAFLSTRALPPSHLIPFTSRRPPPSPHNQLALLTRLNDEVLDRRGRPADPASLSLSATLLEHNPEAYTAWNFRREALGPVLAAGGAAAVEAAAAELALTEKALLRNPKSYAAWHARRWVVGHRLASLAAEVRLVDALLDVDARNFHAWAHRGWACDLGCIPAADQLFAAAARIEADFSNYSAWHARSALLARMHWEKVGGGRSGGGGGGGDDGGEEPPTTLAALLSSAPAGPSSSGGDCGGGGDRGTHPTAKPTTLPLPVLAAECALVRAATFTDPTDQAPWFYQRWLVGQVVAGARAAVAAEEEGGGGDKVAQARRAEAIAAADAALAAEAAACEELLAAEPDRALCKWPLLALAHLADARAGLAALVKGGEQGGRGGGGGEDATPPPAKALYDELAALDPMRRGFYEDAAAGRAAVVVPEV